MNLKISPKGIIKSSTNALKTILTSKYCMGPKRRIALCLKIKLLLNFHDYLKIAVCLKTGDLWEGHTRAHERNFIELYNHGLSSKNSSSLRVWVHQILKFSCSDDSNSIRPRFFTCSDLHQLRCYRYNKT